MRCAVYVFTYRDGLLAKLAHDLRLHVGAFELVVEGDAVRGWFDASSLRVDGVMHGERIETSSPSPVDRQQIEETIRREVLRAEAFPRIELEGSLARAGASASVHARLRLHGHEQPLRIPISAEGGALSAEVTFSPSQFGIKPYKALGGAIRTADRVRVRVVAEQANWNALAASPCTFGPES